MSRRWAQEVASRWQRWCAGGEVATVLGRRIFFVDQGPRSEEAICLLHGFPSCSYDYHAVLGLLAARHRVIVHDHAGFGASDKNRSGAFSLRTQAALAAELWRSLGLQRCHLVAHDYGTSVATELLSLREEGELGIEIDSLTLSNGSIYLEMADLLLTQRLLRHPVTGPLMARLTSRRFFKARMRGLWADRSRVDDLDLEVLWRALTTAGGRLVLPKLSRYLDERVQFRARWVGALRRLDLATLILWGRQDPVAVLAIGQRLAREIPGAEAVWLEGTGHYPMLEAPRRWALPLLEFVAANGESQSPMSR